MGTKEMEVKEEEEVIQKTIVTEPVASSKLGFQKVEKMRKVQDALYLHTRSTALMFKSFCTSTSLRMGSPCWILWSWYSVTRHIIFKTVSRAPILAVMP